MRDIIDLAGRIFLATIFLFEAVDSTIFFEKTKESMTYYGLTWNQDLLLYGAIFLLTLGGIMILLGYRTTIGVAMLLMYWIPVTFITHDFWNYPKPEMREQSVMFMQQMAIAGGLMMLIGKGSGKYSIRRLLATTVVKQRSWRK